MDRIFVYGFTEDNNISLLKECNLKVKLQGVMTETSVNKDSVKDFIGEYLSDRDVEEFNGDCLLLLNKLDNIIQE